MNRLEERIHRELVTRFDGKGAKWSEIEKAMVAVAIEFARDALILGASATEEGAQRAIWAALIGQPKPKRYGVILEKTNTASNIESRHATEAEAYKRATEIESHRYQAGIVVRMVSDDQTWCDVEWDKVFA